MARQTSCMEHLRVDMPEPLMVALDNCAAQSDQTRSALAREFMVLGLKERGMWPPPVRNRGEGK